MSHSINDFWLKKLFTIRTDIDKAMGHGVERRAPHKPLLLLCVLEMVEEGLLLSTTLALDAPLVLRFQSYWKVVVKRWTRTPELRLPFHHLSSDGVWTALTSNGERSPHRSLTTQAVLDPSFYQAVQDASFRASARALLIQTYFPLAEQAALKELTGITLAPAPDDALEVSEATMVEAKRAARDARFRIQVVSAYDFTCALTGHRLTTLRGGTLVDAAHIYPHAKSRNDAPNNGLALSKSAHWMFDEGLWTLTDALLIRVSQQGFAERGPEAHLLMSYDGRPLVFAASATLRPDLRFVRWHREHCFIR